MTMASRLEQLHDWLNTVLDVDTVELKPASEDASFRCYYRILHDSKHYIVMDAPPLHENCDAFIDIAKRLVSAEINAPEILHTNLEQGFLIISDLGQTHYLSSLKTANAQTLYQQAIDALLVMQKKVSTEELPDYDSALLENEINLFYDWLLKQHLQLDDSEFNQGRHSLTECLITNALEQPQAFVHRDYHSRNLMLTDINNPGVIDFQDAVSGPISYDLVSLLKDCYVKWPQDLVTDCINYYLERLKDKDIELAFNRAAFQRWFDLMGVQRHLKASGIFARLYHRDGKSGYLKDIPRTLSYITELGDQYPELSELCELIERKVLPAMGTKK